MRDHVQNVKRSIGKITDGNLEFLRQAISLGTSNVFLQHIVEKTMKPTKFLTLAVGLLLAIAASCSASVGDTATWTSWEATSAAGMLNGVNITATTNSEAPFVGIAGNHFGAFDGECGSWDGSDEYALDHDVEGLIASNVNKGDYQEFTFSSAFTNGLLYIENFDSRSKANIKVTGATSIALVDASESITFDVKSGNGGVLASSNRGYDGEGDLVLALTGDVTSIRIDYTRGEGANGVFYTFAQACPVPEPTSALVMAGLFGLGGLLYIRRKKK